MMVWQNDIAEGLRKELKFQMGKVLGEGGAEMLSESQEVDRALVSEHDANLSVPVPKKESWKVCIGTQSFLAHDKHSGNIC